MQDKGIALGSVVLTEDNRPQQWYEIIASDINIELLKVEVDDKQIEFESSTAFMENNLDIMLPADIFNDVFKCAINYYSNEKIVLQKSSIVTEIYIDDLYIYVNGNGIYLPSAMQIRDNTAYINAEVLEQAFGYKYVWESKTNTVKLVNTKKEESIFPTSYSYISTGRMPYIKNQGSFSTCWAFAALSALETSILPKERYVFSVDNMVGNNGFSSSPDDGGDYNRAIAYLTAWRGPVLECDDIYGDGIIEKSAEVVKHVQEVQLIESKNFEAIKRAVFLYGGVESSMYTSMNGVGETSMYYNEETSSYCYIGTEKPNHDVTIIGWDDNFPRDNFNAALDGDGAFMCVNSWGEDFGENGVFYVSYYDSNIGIHNVVYTKVEEPDNYDNIYQSDICGRVGQLGYDCEKAFFANVYTAANDEVMQAVGFYATGKNTSYELYLVEDFQFVESFENKRLLQSGTFTNEGFYTVELDTDILMEAGKKYAVIVKITTPGSIHPVAIEYKAGKATQNVVIDDGEGYISLYGRLWEHVEETKECNICLKIYTDNIE